MILQLILHVLIFAAGLFCFFVGVCFCMMVDEYAPGMIPVLASAFCLFGIYLMVFAVSDMDSPCQTIPGKTGGQIYHEGQLYTIEKGEITICEVGE